MSEKPKSAINLTKDQATPERDITDHGRKRTYENRLLAVQLHCERAVDEACRQLREFGIPARRDGPVKVKLSF